MWEARGVAQSPESEIRTHDGTPNFYQTLYFHDFSINKCKMSIGIDRCCHCGHVFFFICLETFIFSKLAGMSDFLTCQGFVVKMNVKSYPFEKLMVNVASWTPSKFDKYPKSPK